MILRSAVFALLGALLLSGCAAGVADRIAVFHDGTVVEETAVGNFAAPELLRDPFTRALWYAMPEHGMVVEGDRALGAAPSRVRREMSDGGDYR